MGFAALRGIAAIEHSACRLPAYVSGELPFHGRSGTLRGERVSEVLIHGFPYAGQNLEPTMDGDTVIQGLTEKDISIP